MQTTNEAAARGESDLEKKLRSRSGLHAQMLARAQRERLQVCCTQLGLPLRSCCVCADGCLAQGRAGEMPVRAQPKGLGVLRQCRGSCRQPGSCRLKRHNCDCCLETASDLPRRLPRVLPSHTPAHTRLSLSACQQVMLDEIKGGTADSEARYRAALDGQSLGTHSSGTSADAVAIRSSSAAAPAAHAAAAQAAAAAAAAAGKAR